MGEASVPEHIRSIRWAVALTLTVACMVMSHSSPARAADVFDPIDTPSGLQGLASWYGGGERLNRLNASGHRVNPEALEAAMWDVPFGTFVNVTNRQNGRSIIVRVTDRGPSHRYPHRVIDLSRRAFRELAPLRQGLIPVVVERSSRSRSR